MKLVAEMSKISEQVLKAILLIPVQFRSYRRISSILIGREFHALKGPIIGALSDATPAVLCHKEPARASKAPY